MFVKVVGRVGKGGEEQHLAVARPTVNARVDRRVDLGQNLLLQVLKLGVIGGRNLVHLVQKCLDHLQIGPQVAFPRGQVHVSQMDDDLARGLLLGRLLFGIEQFHIVVRFGVIERRGQVGKGTALASAPVAFNPGQSAEVNLWSLPSVIRKEATELSRRLSRLTVISERRLSSRSFCLSRPPPPLTSVSYIASYFARRLGRM